MNNQAGSYFQNTGDWLGVLPPQASTSAYQYDLLGAAMLAFCTVVVVILIVLTARYCYRFRAGSNVTRKSLPSERRETVVEIAWAVVLYGCFLVFFVWGADVYVNMYRPPEQALVIKVVAKQWMWKAEHPSGAREIDTLHVPVGRKVRLDMTSMDVIHSFYVPAFRLKKDVVPGMTTSIWFKATEVGTYHLFCAEYCGTNHSRMRGRVIVMTPEAYSAWTAAHGHEQKPALAGKQLFMTYGCSGCHMGSSVVDAPKLAGIYGRAVPLANGTTTVADEAYIRDSILRPQKHIAAGYAPIMPDFSGRISDAELQKIVAYIRSLEPDDWLKQELGDTQ